MDIEIREHGWAWWCILIISALRRLRQKDHGFKAIMGYTARFCLTKPKKKTTQNKEIREHTGKT
jgi:hypothetical protein